MKKVWVVVANRSDAKIYKTESLNKLVEYKTLSHKEAHLHDQDLISDAPGRMSRRGHNSETLSQKTSVQEKEAALFAKEIAAFLEKGCATGECECIYIIAKAPFLGFLRDALVSKVTKLVAAEIQKDIVNLTTEEIRSYLPRNL